jgi:hypothetical protein
MRRCYEKFMSGDEHLDRSVSENWHTTNIVIGSRVWRRWNICLYQHYVCISYLWQIIQSYSIIFKKSPLFCTTLKQFSVVQIITGSILVFYIPLSLDIPRGLLVCKGERNKFQISFSSFLPSFDFRSFLCAFSYFLTYSYSSFVSFVPFYVLSAPFFLSLPSSIHSLCTEVYKMKLQATLTVGKHNLILDISGTRNLLTIGLSCTYVPAVVSALTCFTKCVILTLVTGLLSCHRFMCQVNCKDLEAPIPQIYPPPSLLHVFIWHVGPLPCIITTSHRYYLHVPTSN